MANVKRVLNNKEIKVDMSTTVNLEMTTIDNKHIGTAL